MKNIAKIKLSSYKKTWPIKFQKEKQDILKIIGDKDIVIEHIGSTAIEGAIAKPEIDIMIGVPSLERASALIPLLESIGYVYFQKFEEFVPERRYLRKSKSIVPLVHIHIVKINSDFWNSRMILKEYMLKHPEVIKEYNELKKKLIVEFEGDRKGYSKAKEQFLLDLLKNAKK